jgi:hypothetical protein
MATVGNRWDNRIVRPRTYVDLSYIDRKLSRICTAIYTMDDLARSVPAGGSATDFIIMALTPRLTAWQTSRPFLELGVGLHSR